MSMLPQGAFTGGELSPSLFGRTDLERFQLSLKKCRNMLIQVFGGIKNRGGTKFITKTKSNGNPFEAGTSDVQLVPFERSSEVSFMLEFGLNYMRVMRNGAQLLYPVGHASAGLPVEVTTDYTEAQVAELQFTQSVDVLFITCKTHKPMRLEKFSANYWDWRIVAFDYKLGPWLPSNADESITVTVSAATGSNVTVTASAGIFTSAHSEQLFKVEATNFAQPWEVNKSVVSGEERRSDGKYYRAVAGGTTVTLRPFHESGRWHDGGVEWEFLHFGFGVVKLKTAGTLESNGKSKTMTADVVSRIPSSHATDAGSPNTKTILEFNGWSYDGVLKPDTYDVTTTAPHTFGAPETYATLAWSARFRMPDTSFIDLTGNYFSYITSTTSFLIGDRRLPALLDYFESGTVTKGGSAVASVTGTSSWAFGAWGPTPGYPACSTFYQQRLCFGGSTSEPNAFWMSKTDQYDNFGTSSPLQADDAITRTIVSSQLNDIRALVAMDKLLIMTSGGVWLASSGVEDVLAPTNISTRLQSFRGSDELSPIGVGSSIVYLQNKGKIVRDLAYEFSQDKYLSDDMNVMAAHLTIGTTIVDWAYQEHPFSILWMVRSDGILLGVTYMREQRVLAWHRHDIGGAGVGMGIVERVAVVSENGTDAVYLLVNRPIYSGGEVPTLVDDRYIERMEDRLTSAPVFLDCWRTINSNTRLWWSMTNFSAIDAAGAEFEFSTDVEGDYVNPTGMVYPIKVGLPITCDVELLSVNDPRDPAYRTRNKLVTNVAFLVYEGKYINVGNSYAALEAVNVKSADNYFSGDGSNMYGIAEAAVPGVWSRDPSIVIRHNRPSPLTILAVIPEVSVGS